jgi:hypothetical protein
VPRKSSARQIGEGSTYAGNYAAISASTSINQTCSSSEPQQRRSLEKDLVGMKGIGVLLPITGTRAHERTFRYGGGGSCLKARGCRTIYGCISPPSMTEGHCRGRPLDDELERQAVNVHVGDPVPTDEPYTGVGSLRRQLHKL